MWGLIIGLVMMLISYPLVIVLTSMKSLDDSASKKMQNTGIFIGFIGFIIFMKGIGSLRG
jgi:hypothetical protein